MPSITISAEEMTEAIERFYRMEHNVLEALRDLSLVPRQELRNSDAIHATLRLIADNSTKTYNTLLIIQKQQELMLEQSKPALSNSKPPISEVGVFKYSELRRLLTDFIDVHTNIPTGTIRDRVYAFIQYMSTNTSGHVEFMRMLQAALEDEPD